MPRHENPVLLDTNNHAIGGADTGQLIAALDGLRPQGNPWGELAR
jgi:hypothetical protein